MSFSPIRLSMHGVSPNKKTDKDGVKEVSRYKEKYTPGKNTKKGTSEMKQFEKDGKKIYRIIKINAILDK